MKALIVMIPEEMHEALRKMSYENRLSISEIVRRAIGKEVKEKTTKK